MQDNTQFQKIIKKTRNYNTDKVEAKAKAKARKQRRAEKRTQL